MLTLVDFQAKKYKVSVRMTKLSLWHLVEFTISRES